MSDWTKDRDEAARRMVKTAREAGNTYPGSFGGALEGAVAEIERLTAKLAGIEGVAAQGDGMMLTISEQGAEIERLTAELAAARASYQARETEWRAGRVKLDPSERAAADASLEARALRDLFAKLVHVDHMARHLRAIADALDPQRGLPSSRAAYVADLNEARAEGRRDALRDLAAWLSPLAAEASQKAAERGIRGTAPSGL